jgi:uncharacterized protein YegL
MHVMFNRRSPMTPGPEHGAADARVGPFVQLHLLADASGSMSQAIDEVNRGLAEFASGLRSDVIARHRVEVTLIRFGSSAELLAGPVLACDFQAPMVALDGLTATGAAINLSLDVMERRCVEYRIRGVHWGVPWLVMFTDGCATDDTRRARRRIARLAARGGMSFHAFGTSGADMRALGELCPLGQQPQRVADGAFEDLFRWVARKVSAASRRIDCDPCPVSIERERWG